MQVNVIYLKSELGLYQNNLYSVLKDIKYVTTRIYTIDHSLLSEHLGLEASAPEVSSSNTL